MSRPAAKDVPVAAVHPFGRERFMAVWNRRLQRAETDAAAAYAEIDRLLGSPARHFHNLDHIHDCIDRVDEVAPLVAQPDLVELALWFHDAILEPGARDNERRSAQLFLDLSDGADDSLRQRIVRLILATAHAAATQYGDRAYVVDIDLAGLGAPWDEFMHKGGLLRQEAANQDDDQYYRAQIMFLTRLLQRRWLYATDYFRATYEGPARGNLGRLLELRASQGYAA